MLGAGWQANKTVQPIWSPREDAAVYTILVSFQCSGQEQIIKRLIYLRNHSRQIHASSTSSPPHSPCLASKVHAWACFWNAERGLFQLIRLFVCCFSLCSSSSWWVYNYPILIRVWLMSLISLNSLIPTIY